MQRRFVEVYEQISANLEETRRYYTKAQILKKYHCWVSSREICQGAELWEFHFFPLFVCAVQHADRHAQVPDQGDSHFYLFAISVQYNTLTDTHKFLTKEISILNSIATKYPAVCVCVAYAACV